MSFETEKETEYWMRPMWARLPLPGGGSQLVENTRQFWASYWHLRDRHGYSDEDLASYAERVSQAKNLPYELGFVIGLHSLPIPKAT